MTEVKIASRVFTNGLNHVNRYEKTQFPEIQPI